MLLIRRYDTDVRLGEMVGVQGNPFQGIRPLLSTRLVGDLKTLPEVLPVETLPGICKPAMRILSIFQWTPYQTPSGAPRKVPSAISLLKELSIKYIYSLHHRFDIFSSLHLIPHLLATHTKFIEQSRIHTYITDSHSYNNNQYLLTSPLPSPGSKMI